MTISQSELNDKIDQLYKLRKECTEWSSLLTDLKEQAKEIEQEVVEAMSDIGLSRAGTTSANISISSQIVPTVDTEHWEELRVWIMANDYQQLFPRSINQAAYRELVNMGIEVPHVDSFDKMKVSVVKSK
jgi:hypothetical protein